MNNRKPFVTEDGDEIDFEAILHRFALWGGIALAIVSIYFSYDGLDQTIDGVNGKYSDMAKLIGAVMALIVTLLQFIFNSDFAKLSLTMRIIGFGSYAYSLYTNYLGINHLFGFSGLACGAISFVMDVAPEAMIAWATDSTTGDLFGNAGKFILGIGQKKQYRQRDNRDNRDRQNHQDRHQNDNRNREDRRSREQRHDSMRIHREPFHQDTPRPDLEQDDDLEFPPFHFVPYDGKNKKRGN